MPTAIRFITRIQDADDFADLDAVQFVSMAASAFVTNERVLIGTVNQVIVTDGGAGGNVTLSTPQDIHIGATPQFAGLGIGVAGVAGGIAMADDSWIGIGAATERIIFDAAGDISFAGCNVGIENAAPGAKLDIDINAVGTIGCIVQGAAGQTANLQEWQNSAGGILTRVESDGDIYTTSSISAGAQAVTPVAGEVFRAYQFTSDSPGSSLYCVYGRASARTQSDRAVGGRFTAEVLYNTAAPTRNDYSGLDGFASIHPAQSQNVIEIRGLDFYVSNLSAAGAVLGAAKAINLRTPVATGTITTTYGLFISDFNTGVTNYAIWTEAGLVRLGDNVEIEEVETLTGNVADDYAAGLALDPGYTGAFTVTRHNYIDVQDVSLAGGAAVTDAAVLRFDANIGTHKALPASFNTTDSNGDTTTWAGGMLININGTLYKIPYVAA